MSKRGKGEKCAYCPRTLEAAGSLSAAAATRDHVVPRARGGARTVWACWSCNNLKGDMHPEEWSAFMKANPDWWKTHKRSPRGGKAQGRTAAEVMAYLNACSAITMIDWPWLRELIGLRVRQVGWGPWEAPCA